MSAALQIEDPYVHMIGKVLGGSYRIVGVIDRGGHGSVYAAEHVRIGTPLAVKMLIGASAHNDALLARFAQEAEIVASLRHPHVVTIHDFDFIDGQPYFVMERLEGETLHTRLMREGALHVEDALRIADQVGSALAAAHEAGVVHRDLKPGNVFLLHAPGEPDFVKLIDFGISKRLVAFGYRNRARPSDGGRLHLLGTPHYMAPEQALGDGDVDARTDQFALGTVFWEMITGGVPFLGDGISEVLHAIVDGPTPHLDEEYPGVFPLGLDHVLARALSKEIDGRYPDVGTFVAALHVALDMEPVSSDCGGRPSLPIDQDTLDSASNDFEDRVVRHFATASEPTIDTSLDEE